MFLKEYIKDVFGAVKSLTTGMKRTGILFHPSQRDHHPAVS